MRHNPFGGNGADSFNQTATQILLNPRQRRGFGFAVFNDLELLTILKMFFPNTFKLQGLSRLDISKITDDRS